VVFADVDPETLNLSPRTVAACLSKRTRAVIPVHFGGNPCNMAGLRRLASTHGLEVIEDAAHAHGMRYRGKAPGHGSAAATYSFQSSKNLACGEGGALATTRRGVYDRAWSFHSFGRLPRKGWYAHHVLAWNHRIGALQAALLTSGLARLEAQTVRRWENGAFLNRALGAMTGVCPQADGDEHPATRRAYHLYIWRHVEDATGIARDVFLEALRAEGVPASSGYGAPLQRAPMFTNRAFWHHQGMGGGPARPGDPDYTAVHTPGGDRVCAEAVWLPHACLLGTRREMQGIVDAVAKVLAARDALRRPRGRGRPRGG
jgi:dTDP-4-amino-4,6-dideoxygalactose transaminase